MLTEFTEAAVDIARVAGQMLREHLHEKRVVDVKTSPSDLVTEMDRRVEAFVSAELGRRFPDHDVRGEEGARTEKPGALYRWHVDPLDGTNNYLHRFPWFAVSLGLERIHAPTRERLVAGAVYNVMMDEMFWASLGQGAWLNGQRIAVSTQRRLDASLLATGFPYWVKDHPQSPLSNLGRMLPLCRDIRRAGAAAIDLAYVACGRFDAYFEEGIQTWDVAAGVLLVREAGGTVTDYDGEPVPMPTAHILASNGQIHGPMHALLQGSYR